MHVLTNKIEMLEMYGYQRSLGIDEEAVKGVIRSFLSAQGYNVSVGKKREHGPDIRAHKDGKNVLIEAKGEGSRPEMFNNFFVNALGEVLQRMRLDVAEYGIALPAHKNFVRLISGLPDVARNVIHLNFYLVDPLVEDARPSPDFSRWGVGLLKWDVR